MTIETHGTINNTITVSKEAVLNGTRTTIVETDEIGSLEPESLGHSDDALGVVVSSIVVVAQSTYDQKTTVYEDIEIGEDVIRVVGVGREEPIETHPAFSETVDGFDTIIAGTGEEPENGAIFIPEGDPNAKFDYFPPDADEDLAGVESYLVPSVVVEVTKRFKNFDDVGWDQIYDIGRIKSPTADINVGDRNWLLVGVQYTNENGIWIVTNQYQLSGDKGWNELLYQTA